MRIPPQLQDARYHLHELNRACAEHVAWVEQQRVIQCEELMPKLDEALKGAIDLYEMSRKLLERFENETPRPGLQSSQEEIQARFEHREQFELLTRMAHRNLEGLEQLHRHFFEHCNQE